MNKANMNAGQTRTLSLLSFSEMSQGHRARISSIKGYSTRQCMQMEKLDRIFISPCFGMGLAQYFFKTSEGLMGPFGTHATAISMLDNYVSECKKVSARDPMLLVNALGFGKK